MSSDVPLDETSAPDANGSTGSPARERQPSVLVVEDDETSRSMVKWFFIKIGYQVHEASNGLEALRSAASTDPDMILLDLTMPVMDGMEVLAKIRQTSKIPIIVVSGKIDKSDRIAALDLGADDYMTKPISLEELEARVRAIFRRVDPQPASGPVQVGLLAIDKDQRTVHHGNVEIPLSRKEFDLLVVLASKPGKVFSREELLNTVWGSKTEWQDSATVTEHIRRLRRKIGENGEAGCVIEAERGVGYKLVEVS